ncbi:MAG: glycoside hydrolase family 5 protein [Lacunisphaera sp.]
MKSACFALFALFAFARCASGSDSSQAVTTSGPVSVHGLLHTQGNKIVGADGQPVSLAGVSFGWSQWEARPYYNADVVHWLKTDWKSSVVRAPLGITPDGYLGHPEENKKRVCAVVDAAIADNLYVLIDWHDHHANQHTDLAIAFFQEMARKYGTQPNVMYEIFNEPIKGLTWSNDVKPYAEKVIAAIRAIDPDNLIIVGTPNWSQDVDLAAEDPIKANNIAYSLHFYAGSHKQKLRDKAVKAMTLGLPLFVTEWGTCDASGKGKVDVASTEEWMTFMRKWDLSHCNWGLYPKQETASIILPAASAQGGWKDEELTESGRLARKWVREWAENSPVPSVVSASN